MWDQLGRHLNPAPLELKDTLQQVYDCSPLNSCFYSGRGCTPHHGRGTSSVCILPFQLPTCFDIVFIYLCIYFYLVSECLSLGSKKKKGKENIIKIRRKLEFCIFVTTCFYLLCQLNQFISAEYQGEVLQALTLQIKSPSCSSVIASNKIRLALILFN